MALNHSPKIVTSGLIFAYDVGNTQKSWNGAPATNLYGDFATSSALRTNTQHFTYGGGWVTSGYTDPGAPSPGFYLGKVYKFVSGSLNSSWSGNSYGYMYKDIASTNAQAYTMSFWAYVSTDCNIDALPASVEITSGYAAANLPGTYDMSKKGTWQRIGASSTGVGTSTRWLVYPARNGVIDGSFSGYFLVAGVQVETGTFATPYTETSRSTTTSIVDLTGRSTITANNLTYNSDNTFNFTPASGGTVRFPISTALNKLEGSIDMWIYPQGYNGGNGLFVNRIGQTANALDWLWAGPYGDVFYFRLGDGAACCNLDLTVSSWSTRAPLNTWRHVCVTWKSAGTSAIYVNGALVTSRSITTIPSTSPDTVGEIGNGHAYNDGSFNGKIPVVKIYNRQLSAVEVKQNFAAQRGRFGL